MSSKSAHLDIPLSEFTGSREAILAAMEAVLQPADNVEKIHITSKDQTEQLCLHYDPDLISLDQLKAKLSLAKIKLAPGYQQETIVVDGMDCPDCAKIIEHVLSKQAGVLAAKVSYASAQLRLEFDAKTVSIKKLTKLLKGYGYTLKPEEKPKNWWQRNYEMVFSVFAGVLLFAAWPVGKVSATASLMLGLIAFASAGWLTIRDSIQTLLQGRFDIDVLMVFAAFGAGSMGAWNEGALLLFLFSLGHALEHRAMDRARNAVKALADLAPKMAMVVESGVAREVAVEALRIGDHVRVLPGQRIPVDGIVREGASAVDQAPITGESIPVDKQADDEVFAGTVNGEGMLMVEVVKLPQDSTLNRMVKLVLEADTQKSPTQQFTDIFVKYFVPIVLIGVVALIFVPPLLMGAAWKPTLYRALSVLVAASPCALAIATPASVLSGVTRAAQKGILIKGGMHLENLGRIKAIAFDKTGTLTQGKPQVSSIVALSADERTVLATAAAIEKLSGHPLAKAVVKAAEEKSLDLPVVTEMQSVTGKGVMGNLNGQVLKVGALKLFTSVPQDVVDAAEMLSGQGCTVMVVQLSETYLGLIGVQDVVRGEAKSALRQLAEQGIEKTIMLTGDNARVANAIAQSIGITDVKSDLMPEDKLSVISQLEKENQMIAMVGDGVNDAPAMARATVGIAMGGAGTDVALEASDVALMADDLSKLPFAVKLSRAAQRVIRQNLWVSLGVVFLLLIGTITGLAGMSLAVVVHEGSTLVVVANALRLLRVREREK